MPPGVDAPAVTVDPEAAGRKQSSDRLILAALCVSAFLASLNFFAATPFYAQIADDLDTTVPLLGQATTVMGLLSAFLGLAIGPIADRYGFRTPLVLGMVAITISLLGTGIANSYLMILVMSVAGGFGDAVVVGIPLAIAGSHFTGAAQRQAIGWTIGSLSSAAIIGVPILTFIGDLSGWRSALIAAGVASALAGVFVAYAIPRDSRRPESPFRAAEILAAYRPMLRHGPTVRLYVATLLRGITWLGFVTYLGAFMKKELGVETRMVGFAYTAMGIGYVIGSFIAARARWGLPARRVIAMMCLIGAAGVAALILAGGFWSVLPILLCLAISAAIAGVTIASLLAIESPAGTGTTMVLNGSIYGLGGTLGAALGGALIAAGGYDLLLRGLPIFAVVAAVVALWPSDGTGSLLHRSTSK